MAIPLSVDYIARSGTGFPDCWGDSLHGFWFEISVLPPETGPAVHLYFYQRDNETGIRREVGCTPFPASPDTVAQVFENALTAGLLWLSSTILSDGYPAPQKRPA